MGVCAAVLGTVWWEYAAVLGTVWWEYAAVLGTVWWEYAAVLGTVCWEYAAVLENRMVGALRGCMAILGCPPDPSNNSGGAWGHPLAPVKQTRGTVPAGMYIV